MPDLILQALPFLGLVALTGLAVAAVCRTAGPRLPVHDDETDAVPLGSSDDRGWTR